MATESSNNAHQRAPSQQQPPHNKQLAHDKRSTATDARNNKLILLGAPADDDRPTTDDGRPTVTKYNA